MPTQPRPRRQGTADEAAALAFATADAHASAPAPEAAAPEAAAPEAAALDARASGAGSAAVPGTDAPAHDLAAAREERIRRVLDFEAGWLSHGGAKARAIRAEFGWSTTRYYQVLDRLLESTEALRHDPMLVRRLLRLREGR